MAESKRNIKISSPGQIGRYVVGLDVPLGDAIVEASIEITSNDPANLYGENATVNDSTENIDGQDYGAGHAIIFTVVALAGMEQRGRNDDPYKLLISYRTDATDPDHDDLTFSKEVDVYPEGIPIP